MNGVIISEVYCHTHLGVTTTSNVLRPLYINTEIAKADKRLLDIRRFQKLILETVRKHHIKELFTQSLIMDASCVKQEPETPSLVSQHCGRYR